MGEMLGEERYWIFWDDKIYNSGIGHWSENKKEIEDILEKGFYDGEGNRVEDFIITDYDLNIVYRQGETINIDNTVLPNIKLIGDCRYVDLKSKEATDISEEAVLMSILKSDEMYDKNSLQVYAKENKEQITNNKIVERLKKLREKIINEYMPDYVCKVQDLDDEENYDVLLSEISEMVWKLHQVELSNETFKEGVEEIVVEDKSLRISGVNKTIEDIKTLMRSENKELEEEAKGKD